MMTPKIFLVGGAVRDILLGKEPKDRDFVVVGADPQWMLDHGFNQVGASFPVFLHPETGDEYALARREKKVAPGYQGFEFEFGPHVTLEDDLLRRDLTINAMAMDEATGEFFDPYGGRDDLTQGVIRHTSEAFAEDPLRVLRVARFAARYEFQVAIETVELCERLVKSGEIDALSADRVWSELEKLFSECRSSIGLLFLERIGAFDTKRLINLMYRPVIEFHEIYSSDVEPELSFIQKLFFNTMIQDLPNDLLNVHRVPHHYAREVKFYAKVYQLLEDELIHLSFNPIDFVALFDQFREELKQGKLSEVKELVKKLTNGDDVFRAVHFIECLENALVELLKLNFTELTKGLQPREIKPLVLQTKLDVVKKFLR